MQRRHRYAGHNRNDEPVLQVELKLPELFGPHRKDDDLGSPCELSIVAGPCYLWPGSEPVPSRRTAGHDQRRSIQDARVQAFLGDRAAQPSSAANYANCHAHLVFALACIPAFAPPCTSDRAYAIYWQTERHSHGHVDAGCRSLPGFSFTNEFGSAWQRVDRQAGSRLPCVDILECISLLY